MILTMILTIALQGPVADDHEYADLLHVKASVVFNKYITDNPVTEPDRLVKLKDLFQFYDFYGTTLDGKTVNFHLPSKPGYKKSRILFLSYTAEWCKNCDYEAPYLGKLYEKYHSLGLEIVMRTEYSKLDKVRDFIKKHDIKYPVIIGSIVAYDKRETIRMETFQYLLRKTLGDTRKYGTPFNIIIVDGDIENPYVILGEMRSDQVNDLIEHTLAGTQ